MVAQRQLDDTVLIVVKYWFESDSISPFYYNDLVKNEKCFVLVVFYNFRFKNVSYLGQIGTHAGAFDGAHCLVCLRFETDSRTDFV